MDIYRPLSTLHALQRCAQIMGMAVVPPAKKHHDALILVNEDGTHYEIGGTDELPRDRLRTALMWMYQEWSEDHHIPVDFTQFD
jgi:hypothetical protein